MNATLTDELLESLIELRQAQPMMRLGQLIASLTMVARGDAPGAIWEVEDEELTRAARWQIGQLESAVADPRDAA